MKKILITIAIMVATIPSFAQFYADDALRYSQYGLTGTARIQSMGGSQVAIGGDMGSFGINPAGLGFYRNSDFAFTGTFLSNNSSAAYFNSNSTSNRDRLNISNLGVVFAKARSGETGFNNNWMSFNIGVSYNRTNDYNANYTYSGLNPNSSITSYFADQAFTNGLTSSGETLSIQDAAYDTYLINDFTTSGGELSFSGLSETGNVQQLKRDLVSGGSGDFNVAFGANYGNRLFLGGSVSYVNVNYRKDSRYTETGINDPGFNPEDGNGNVVNVQSFEYNDLLEHRGSGVNVKIGAIVRATENFRIGASIHSPTYLNVTEDYNTSITSFGNSTDYTSSFGGESYEFDVRTPLKLNGGLAYFFGENGFITGDVEFVDYAGIRYTSNDAGLDQEINGEITDRFQSAVNYRAGAEVKSGPFSIRAGYGFLGSPYINETENYDGNYYTGGVGYRYQRFYLDLAGTYNNQPNLNLSPYSASNANGNNVTPVANLDNKRVHVLLTLGTRF